VLNLRDVPDNAEIGPERLASADPGGPDGEILLLSAGWDRRRDPDTPAFWTEAPWLSRAAAEWLHARRPTAVAFDFPQDYPIRLLLENKSVPNDQHVTHDVLLKNGVTLIEYLVNTSGPRAAGRPVRGTSPDPGADGAPARAFAIEGLPA
jgi:kynurenine formamidase